MENLACLQKTTQRGGSIFQTDTVWIPWLNKKSYSIV